MRIAFQQGFRLARRARPAIWVLYLVNLGLAVLAALPIYRGILRFTGHSLMSPVLSTGFSLEWFIDFSHNSPGSLDRYAEFILLVGLLSIPINTVLAGGVLGRFLQPDSTFSLRAFFHDTGRYAWRLIRLLVLGLVCYWIVFRIFRQGLMNLIENRTYNWQSDRTVFALQLGASLVLFLTLGLVNMVMDYARVKLVREDGASAVEAFLSSLGFTLSRLRKAAAVYALPTLASLALLGVYWLVVPWSLINTPGAAQGLARYREPLAVALLFVGQQAVMFGRYWLRVATWGSEWSYYSASR
jgi:hypothetical protein